MSASIVEREMMPDNIDKKTVEKIVKEFMDVIKIIPLPAIDIFADVLRKLSDILFSLQVYNRSINILINDAKAVRQKFLTVMLHYKDRYTNDDRLLSLIYEILSYLINSDVNKSASLLLDYISAEGSIGVDFNTLMTETLYKAYNNSNNNDKYLHIVSSILTYTMHYTRSNADRQLILGRVENFIEYTVLFIDLKYDYFFLNQVFTMFGNLLGTFSLVLCIVYVRVCVLSNMHVIHTIILHFIRAFLLTLYTCNA